MHNSEEIILIHLRQLVSQQGSQKEAARLLGISPQYLSDLLRERREVSRRVAAKLGYNKVAYFEAMPTLEVDEHE